MASPDAPVDPFDEPDTSGLPTEREWEYEIDQAVYEAPIPLDKEIFTPTGLQIDIEDMEFSEWARLGDNVERMAKGHQWWGGDWHNLGEDKWGDEIWQVLDEFAANTIRNWGITCRAFPYEHRIPDVDWSHWRYAAELRTLPSRKKCIRLAVENDWTTEQTRQYVREQNGTEEKNKKEKGETTSITFTGGWNVAPADEQAADAIALQVMDHAEKLFAEAGVEPRGMHPFDKRFNE